MCALSVYHGAKYAAAALCIGARCNGAINGAVVFHRGVISPAFRKIPARRNKRGQNAAVNYDLSGEC